MAKTPSIDAAPPSSPAKAGDVATRLTVEIAKGSLASKTTDVPADQLAVSTTQVSTDIERADWPQMLDTTAPMAPESILSAPDDAPLQCVVVIAGREIGKRYELGAGELTLGRLPENEIAIEQDTVSRKHAVISRLDGGRYAIRDLGSTNGTFVNDKALKKVRELHDGDLVKLGHTVLKCLSGRSVEAVYHDELYRLSTLDGLTQIHNKRFFLEALDKEVSRARRYSRSLSLAMIDLDDFKQINDSLGHLAGDYVLKELALLISGRIRKEDTFARYGGEEFALILPETDKTHAVAASEKLRALVAEHGFFWEQRIGVTVSIGVAALEDDTGAQTLIRRSDEKLYESKRSGRNRVSG